MNRAKNILKNAAVGGDIYTDSFPNGENTYGFFIKNASDVSLDFDLQAALVDDDKDGDLDWAAVLSPYDDLQVTFTATSGENAFRTVTGAPTGIRFRLYCDSSAATTGTVTINVGA